MKTIQHIGADAIEAVLCAAAMGIASAVGAVLLIVLGAWIKGRK